MPFSLPFVSVRSCGYRICAAANPQHRVCQTDQFHHLTVETIEVDAKHRIPSHADATDARLLYKARIALVRLASKQGVKRRQSYERFGRTTFVRSQRYAQARHISRAGAQSRKLRTYLDRVICDIERKMVPNEQTPSRMTKVLQVATRIHT